MMGIGRAWSGVKAKDFILYGAPALAMLAAYTLGSKPVGAIIALILAAAYFIWKCDGRALVAWGSFGILAAAALFDLSTNADNKAAWAGYWMVLSGLTALIANLLLGKGGGGATRAGSRPEALRKAKTPHAGFKAAGTGGRNQQRPS